MLRLPTTTFTRRHAIACGVGMPLLTLEASAQETELAASLSLEPNEGGAPVFQVTLNGVSARAVIELDMPEVVVDQTFAKQNGLTGTVTLGLGPVMNQVTPALANLSGVKTAFGDQIHVVLGRPLLSRLAIMMDAQGGKLGVLHANVPVSVSASTEILDVVSSRGRATISISLEDGPTLQAGVSYFNGAAISLRETETVKAWLADGRRWSTAFAGSVADPSGTRKTFSLKSVALGRHVLNDVPAVIEPSGGAAGAEPDATLGPLLLNRFLVMLHGTARQVWLTPTPATFNTPIRRSLTGIYAIPASGGVEVVHVGKDSPASNTALKAGDKIATIDGSPAMRAALLDVEMGQELDLRLTTGETIKVKAARYF